MSALPHQILAESVALFDDVRPTHIDVEAHSAFVLVLDRGTLRSVSALLGRYGIDRVRTFFTNGGAEQVSPRTWALWRAFLDLTEDECTSRSRDHRRRELTAAGTQASVSELASTPAAGAEIT